MNSKAILFCNSFNADFYNSFAYCNSLNNSIFREYSIAINSAAIQLAIHANSIAIAKKQES